jgi:undecaprenyl diphosphate synthase
MKNNVRLNTIGSTSNLPSGVQKKLKACIDETATNTGLTLTLALSYSARWEITEAIKSIAESVKNNQLDVNSITDEVVSGYMSTGGIPDPELMIRTSGEQRISNFLLWQLAYSELYFSEILWPDFRRDDLYRALLDYQGRERRFGKTGDQVKK